MSIEIHNMLNALLLLLVANGAPVIRVKLFARHFSYPVDCHFKAPDGHRWLGDSKTFIGVFLAVISTSVMAGLLGYHWQLGASIAALAMMGDLMSSFIKRRLGLPSSSQVPGLDQIPESLLPLSVCAQTLSLDWLRVIMVVLVFWFMEIVLSKILYRFHIRNRPY